ncbi:serine threonine kinase ste20, putative [Ichthyophthirius multifiliis]|uniref:Serine threonine kinase ste20, putative n=1 Tax=Ichthyophthirius multifiliis TaxID=5932 RepID=G0QY74_ICHMU|nr:serine threonine kinase ste20, putative [Ichthyophthirius multifiliis]EGR29813.1 serine threonine kinase ste20, putative [Ichthyophthirius multifiliis]|eukprot:XP_004031049.1 serine threonine kinase ste20, putative [Ichthyophthirius multifiliis]
MSKFQDEYTIKIYESFIYDNKLYIVMEYFNEGSVQDLIRKNGPLSEEYICIILKQVLIALKYLHDNNKLHRDLKASNIMLNRDGSIKLTDFSLSQKFTDILSKNKQHLTSLPFWLSPETIKYSKYDAKSDIWSVAITALEMAYGKPPYSDLPLGSAIFSITNEELQIDEAFSSQFKEFIKLCLNKVSSERASCGSLLLTDFIQRAKKTQFLTEIFDQINQEQECLYQSMKKAIKSIEKLSPGLTKEIISGIINEYKKTGASDFQIFFDC